MKKIIPLFSILLSCFFSYCQITIPAGTYIQIRSVERVSSDGSRHEGEIVNFVVSNDVMIDTTTIIKAGSNVQAIIKEYKGRKGCGQPGKFLLTIDYVRLVNGKTISITNPNIIITGKDKTALSVGLAAGLTVGLCCPPFLAFLAMKGGHAVMEQGYNTTLITMTDTKM